ncbi:MAG TPA: hypothetical protein PK114_03770 [Smithellaceae bacterium]|nr:hypothetical protein [Smithellaceae bacterium]
MSVSKLQDYRSKQKLLYVANPGLEILRHYGDLFFAAGNFSDALDFYQKANFTDGLHKIRSAALDSGDVMNFQRAAKALNMELTSADWEIIAKNALDLKKYQFARHALEKADNKDLLSSLEKIMHAEGHEKVS